MSEIIPETSEFDGVNYVRNRLIELSDAEYAKFQLKITPNVDPSCILGVRVPVIRNLAKEIKKMPETAEFLKVLPHKYYDENMLHGILIGEMKDYDSCVSALLAFLPYVDNWAVCDSMSPKVLGKRLTDTMDLAKFLCASPLEYTCRYGISILMHFFLDDAFDPYVLELASSIHSDFYYINMNIAFFFATALAKQWDDTFPYIATGRLSPWINNKSIQKARESLRISAEQKELLSRYKV